MDKDIEYRLQIIDNQIKKIEKVIWGNGEDGMKDKLNEVSTQQKMMLKLGWLVLSVVVGQVVLFVAQSLAK